jgi:hypothetical protein
VRLGTISEMPFPTAVMIDASVAGVLLSFAEPVVLSPGQRVCVSVPTREGDLHLMAGVVRIERGHDFHTYVGLVLSDRSGSSAGEASPPTGGDVDPDLARWQAWLEDERLEQLFDEPATAGEPRRGVAA